MKSSSWLWFYRRGYLSFLVIAATLAYLLKMTWFKWGDLIIDLGREVYVPVKLAEGAVLYRDIFYLYGPFPPYFNAALVKIFGPDILSFVVSGILVTCLTALLVYKISRMFLNVFFAMFTALVFLFVLAFGNYVGIGNYNFILPYSYPATHAVLFSLGALYFFFRSLEKEVGKDIYFSGLFLFLAMISRVEIGGMLALAFLPAVIMLKFSRIRTHLLRPLILWPMAGALFVYGVFFMAAGPRILESNLFDLFRSNTQASPFAVLLSGADATGQNMALMLKSAFFYLLLALWFALAGYGSSFARRLEQPVVRRVLYALIALVAAAGALFFLKALYNFELQYRSIPVIYLIVGILSLGTYLRSGRKPGELKLFVLALFSFLIVMRIILQVHAWHYGFYILVPGLIVYHVFFYRSLPQLMRNKFLTAAFYAGFTLVLFVLMADHFQFSRAMYQQRTWPVPSPRGTISVRPDPQGAGVISLVDFFVNKTPREATLAVFPEGVMINYLSGRKNPLYYYSFLPQDMVRESVEQSMVDDMAFKKPDYVIVLQRSVEEYGSRGFGVDYGQKIMGFIENNYAPLAQYGPLPFAPDKFSAVILKRNQ